jgi:hypothetical protein
MTWNPKKYSVKIFIIYYEYKIIEYKNQEGLDGQGM